MNNNKNYISLDVIANKIYKNPLLKNVNYEDIIDYALSVIKIANVPGVYQEQSCYKDIINHKAAIPKNALNIKTVDYCVGERIVPMTTSSYTLNNQLNNINTNENFINYGTISQNENHVTYSINNQMITTSCKSGKIFITFDTIKTDEDNIPMIPDSEALLRAIEAYIKLQIYTILVDLGKMSERALNRVEQEYYFNIGKAQTEFQDFQNEDHKESFLNGWKKMFPETEDHRNRYNNNSAKERLNRF